MSSVSSSRRTSIRSSAMTMPCMWRFSSTTGTALMPCSVSKWAISFWSVGRYGVDFGGHYSLDGLCGIGGDEVFEGHHAEKCLIFVKDISVMDGFDMPELLAEIADGFVD